MDATPDKNHKARKRFGQNFLQDQNIIDNIVRAIHPQENDHLVEIGPGQGAITESLVKSGATLDLVEVDRDLVEILENKYGDNPNVTIHSFDALKFDFSSLVKDDKPLRIVGNLPYNISTPLIFHLLSFRQHITDMHFMLQLEVVNRMAAEPGHKNWGRLGIMTQYWCQAESLFTVPPTAFHPVPKVESAIVRLTPFSDLPLKANNEKFLDTLIRTVFNQRRKTLRNTLKPLTKDIDSEVLANTITLDMGLRPEVLSLQQFVDLSNQLSALSKS